MGSRMRYHVVIVQSPSRVQLFLTPRTAACQASLSLTVSQSLPKFMSIESVMPSNHLVLCHPLLLLPSVFPIIRVFSTKTQQVMADSLVKLWELIVSIRQMKTTFPGSPNMGESGLKSR